MKQNLWGWRVNTQVNMLQCKNISIMIIINIKPMSRFSYSVTHWEFFSYELLWPRYFISKWTNTSIVVQMSTVCILSHIQFNYKLSSRYHNLRICVCKCCVNCMWSSWHKYLHTTYLDVESPFWLIYCLLLLIYVSSVCSIVFQLYFHISRCDMDSCVLIHWPTQSGKYVSWVSYYWSQCVMILLWSMHWVH